MDYGRAKDIRKEGLISLLTDKLVSGHGIGESVSSALSERSKATAMGIKEKFDPLNIVKALTFGSNFAPALLGRLTNRSDVDIAHFTEDKGKRKLKRIPGMKSHTFKENMNELLGLIYRSIVRADEDRKLYDELEKNKVEEELAEEDKRNKALIQALTGRKTRTQKKADRRKERKEEKRLEKETVEIEKPKVPEITKQIVEEPVKKGVTARKIIGGATILGGTSALMIGGSRLSVSEAIAKGESAAGSYNAANMGTRGDKIIGIKGKLNLEDMTIGEVMRRQSIKWGAVNESDKLFAVGKYQMIPDTLRDAVRTLNIDPKEKFSGELQERMFNEYLIGKKRPAIAAYLNSPTDDPKLLHQAVKAASLEWASIADPDIPGGRSSHYGSGNKASITVEQMKDYLRKDREVIYAKNKNTEIPNQIGQKLDKDSRENKELKKEAEVPVAIDKIVNNTNVMNQSALNTTKPSIEDDVNAYIKKVLLG